MLAKLAIIAIASSVLGAAIHFVAGPAQDEHAILMAADAFLADLEAGRLDEAEARLSPTFRATLDLPDYRARTFGPVSTYQQIGMLPVTLRSNRGDQTVVLTLVKQEGDWRIDGWQLD